MLRYERKNSDQEEFFYENRSLKSDQIKLERFESNGKEEEFEETESCDEGRNILEKIRNSKKVARSKYHKTIKINFYWTFLISVILALLGSTLYTNIFNQTCEECPKYEVEFLEPKLVIQSCPEPEIMDKQCPEVTKVQSPKYILHDGMNGSGILMTVHKVLIHLGLEKINIDLDSSNFPKDWNLLWTYKHIGTVANLINWTDLKYHQKINHFPGNQLLISKSYLTTQRDFDFIPKGFVTSKQVQSYALEHPEKRFVLKLKSNRGVKLMKPSEMNFTFTLNNEDYFAQEYVEDPLLWNGHKFDFSIFVVITSVNPLRFYYYNKNVNLRFCLKPYSTSNASDVDSYVIGTDHIPGQSFSHVKKYIAAGYTYRDAFEKFIKEIGGNVEDIWQKVEYLIRTVVLTKEKYMIDAIAQLKASKYSFFELYRFDMIFDKDLKLYLIEVNQSPNLLASSERIHNKFMFENVLYNMFNLIGVGSFYNKTNISFPNMDVENMVAYIDALSVKPEVCLQAKCLINCEYEACKFCLRCAQFEKFEMIQAFNEQMNRGHFKRLFPVGKEKIDGNLWEKVSPINKYYVEWFQEMCKKNEYFC